MNAERERVAQLIRQAFEGVTLCDGIGLRQGQALDDYASKEAEDESRARDEKEYWSVISVKELSDCHSSLSFFDAEGMRFHLPAYLIAELEKTLFCGDIVFHLVSKDDYSLSKFTLLNKAQRNAVREFLLLLLDDPDYDMERQQIESALEEYWNIK